MSDDSSVPDFGTLAVHVGEGPDPATRAHNTPIYQTATFAVPHTGGKKQAPVHGEQYTYTRDGNPTSTAFERKMAALENAEDSVLGASGMGVISSAIFTNLSSGDHMVCADTMYPIALEFIRDELPRLGIEVTFVDASDSTEIARAVRPETRMIYVETLANPTMQVIDVPAVVEIARGRDIITMVDNTFVTPYLYRPLDDGVDLVLHSATKYLSGHGDAIAGVISGSNERIGPIRKMISHIGAPISPFNSWLLLRGIKTLHLRMDRHCENAMALAQFLQTHPCVTRVRYPGLSDDPGHAAAARMMGERFGGMLSFDVKGDDVAPFHFAEALRLALYAVSLGDVSTLVFPWKDHNVVRVSAGIEGVDDIIADFEQAFKAIG